MTVSSPLEPPTSCGCGAPKLWPFPAVRARRGTTGRSTTRLTTTSTGRRPTSTPRPDNPPPSSRDGRNSPARSRPPTTVMRAPNRPCWPRPHQPNCPGRAIDGVRDRQGLGIALDDQVQRGGGGQPGRRGRGGDRGVETHVSISVVHREMWCSVGVVFGLHLDEVVGVRSEEGADLLVVVLDLTQTADHASCHGERAAGR